ncbi:hypothetical protein SsS58_08736 [Streptomyces scabiei]|uniref:Uncharacterized protein n=1 Tax=Streptomyces scabiei TaxID=1930 RepID=A0A100JZ02_STRSC|nr:hypothetical protein SsS58_08736 [Streptomyces scabiei]
MVTSLPITSKATWLTTSGITGLTLPGMIDEPACTGGRLISLSPARGPEESSRRSLHVFDSFTATRLSTPDICTNAPQSCVASTRLAAVTSGSPVISARCRRADSAYPAGALRPVPMAVAPRLISWISSTASESRHRSSSIMTAYAENSWPSVIGTASCSWVRPILSTSRNSTALRANESWRTAIALSSPRTANTVAIFTAVG